MSFVVSLLIAFILIMVIGSLMPDIISDIPDIPLAALVPMFIIVVLLVFITKLK